MSNNYGLCSRPSMGPLGSLDICIYKSFDFKGRARRSEFFWYAVFYFFVAITFFFMSSAFFTSSESEWTDSLDKLFISSFFFFLMFTPAFFSALTRRFHDTGRSGWYSWCVVAFVIASIIYSVIVSANSDVEAGEYYHPRVTNQNRSFYILGLVCFVVSFIVPLFDSKMETNKYGKSPKYFNPQTDSRDLSANDRYGLNRQVSEGGQTYDIAVPLSFFQNMKYSFSNLFNFRGRARRAEYWRFFIFFYVIQTFLEAIFFNGYYSGSDILLDAVLPFILYPVMVRRLHDLGYDWKWILPLLLLDLLYIYAEVPGTTDDEATGMIENFDFIGNLIYMVVFALNSRKGDNQFGPSPKYVPVSEPEPPTLIVTLE